MTFQLRFHHEIGPAEILSIRLKKWLRGRCGRYYPHCLVSGFPKQVFSIDFHFPIIYNALHRTVRTRRSHSQMAFLLWNSTNQFTTVTLKLASFPVKSDQKPDFVSFRYPYDHEYRMVKLFFSLCNHLAEFSLVWKCAKSAHLLFTLIRLRLLGSMPLFWLFQTPLSNS